MLDVVLAGATGLILAIVLSNPPKAPSVTSTVVEGDGRARSKKKRK